MSGAGTTRSKGISRSTTSASTAGRTLVIATRCANRAAARASAFSVQACRSRPSAAVTLAEALGISLTQLAGQVTYELDLSGSWWAAWQTWKDGVPRIDTHTLEIHQNGEVLQLDADRAVPVEEGSYRWQGELRLWDNEALLGWYHSTDAAVRSKGTLYLSLNPHGDCAWGRWVGMSYDGLVVSGLGSIARTEELAAQVIRGPPRPRTPQ